MPKKGNWTMNLIIAQPGIIATIYLSPIALLKIIKTPLRVWALTAQTDRRTQLSINRVIGLNSSSRPVRNVKHFDS